MGSAVRNRAGPLRTLLATAGAPTQTPLRLGRQLRQVQRWFPSRTLVVVADGAFASLQLLSDWAAQRRPITCVTRLRLDARLFRPAPPRKKGAMGRPRLVGTRLPSLQQMLTRRSTVWQSLNVQKRSGAIVASAKTTNTMSKRQRP